jgi:hypothetical protein
MSPPDCHITGAVLIRIVLYAELCSDKGLVPAVLGCAFHFKINKQIQSDFKFCSGSQGYRIHWHVTFSTVINSSAVLPIAQTIHQVSKCVVNHGVAVDITSVE